MLVISSLLAKVAPIRLNSDKWSQKMKAVRRRHCMCGKTPVDSRRKRICNVERSLTWLLLMYGVSCRVAIYSCWMLQKRIKQARLICQLTHNAAVVTLWLCVFTRQWRTQHSYQLTDAGSNNAVTYSNAFARHWHQTRNLMLVSLKFIFCVYKWQWVPVCLINSSMCCTFKFWTLSLKKQSCSSIPYMQP